MDFKQFEYVIMLAEEKSFSKAAKRLFVSQPSLSQYISRIELNLGVSLFNRQTAPLSLTYEGVLYLETAKKIIALSNELSKAFDDVRDLKRGSLRVGLTSSKARYPMPSVLPVFRRTYPDIDISITEATSGELEKMLLNGTVDICLMNLPVLSSDVIDCDPVVSEKILLAAPYGSQLGANNGFVELKAFKDRPFILCENSLRIRQIVNRAFTDTGFKPVVVLETRSIETCVRFTAAGLGFSFVPESSVLHSRTADDLEYYDVGSPPLCWTMALAYKKDAYITKAARAFADITKTVVKDISSNIP